MEGRILKPLARGLVRQQARAVRDVSLAAARDGKNQKPERQFWRDNDGAQRLVCTASASSHSLNLRNARDGAGGMCSQ